jgi:hypothetical protein
MRAAVLAFLNSLARPEPSPSFNEVGAIGKIKTFSSILFDKENVVAIRVISSSANASA